LGASLAKVAFNPIAGFMMPRQFGPIKRMELRRNESDVQVQRHPRRAP